jgi:hypothetical protein
MHHKSEAGGMGLKFIPPIDEKTRGSLDAMVAVAKFTVEHSLSVLSTAPTGKVKAKPATAEQLPRGSRSGPKPRSPQEGDLVERMLADELEKRRTLKPHQQLGLAIDATVKDIDRAFLRLSEQYHPAIFERYPDGTRELVRQLQQLVHDAHSALRKK